jgi:hypothetical protein
MVGDYDLFTAFRSLLFLFLAIYAALMLWSMAWQVRRFLAGRGSAKRLLRTYLAYQIVTIRVQPAVGELLQIGFLLMVLLVIWWLHAKV